MKTVILTIPGIGTKKPGYSNKFEKKLRNINESDIQIVECMPFSITGIDQNQDSIFERLNINNNLGGILSLRKFVIGAFGDGLSFEHSKDSENSNYKKIHTYLKSEIEKVNKLLNIGDKFIILAASMGVHVLSTYIWDADNAKGIFENEHSTAENNLKNLNKLITIGCNIPLFVSGLDKSSIVPFSPRNSNFTWDNFYDKDDVLGFPLADMSKPYSNVVIDHDINVGMYIGSHVRYWTSSSFIKPFSELIKPSSTDE